MNLAQLKQKIKHFGEEKVYCFGIANIGHNGQWALFYDVDSWYNDFTVLDIINQTFGADTPVFIKHTKHGTQYLTLPLYSLKEVYSCFMKLKQNVKTDYFWSIPLWLRISEKFNERGEIISPAPKPEYKNLNEFFKLKKLYSTWD